MDTQEFLRANDLLNDVAANQEQLQKARPAVHNLAKLGYRQIFYQKQNRLLVSELICHIKNYSVNYFNAIREIHEKGVKKFRQTYSVQENVMVHQKRKRGYSIDSHSAGTYYLNNWISTDEYPCEKPSLDEKSAHLIYQILASQWTKAIQIVDSLNKNIEIMTLSFILKGFKAIENIIAEQSQYFQTQFLNRDRYQISFKSSSDSVSGSGSYVNVFEQDAKSKFLDLKGTPRKIECLKMNLDYLVNFAARYEVTSKDDYIVLAFQLLGNSLDQDESITDPSKDYSKILVNLNLKIYDRLNFAIKLLPEKKRKPFCNDLDQALTSFPSLDNILFYLSSSSKTRQQKIDQICKAYLDEYGDLQTVAYISLNLPFLRKYYHQYKHILQFADQFKQIQRIQHYRWGDNTQELKETIDTRRDKKMTSFFDFININEEKIMEPKITKDSSNICEICSKKMQKGQHFLECGKCRHGGHTNHLLKWFEESENCPHIGCPCVCN